MSKPLTSQDPTAIFNAARCFCLPHFHELALKTFQLSGVVVAASPPCRTPTAPVAHFESVTNHTLAVKWVQPANPGSLITSYLVQLGTVSGVYTMSQVRGAGTHGAVFTGLNSGTTYFALVTAVSFTGCTASAPEISTTTAGPPPSTGLLNGLIAYWKMDEGGASGNRADATGNGWTAVDTNNNVSSVAGLINNGAAIGSLGVLNQGLVVSANIDTRAQTTPFTIQLWLRQVDVRAGNSAIATIASGGTGGFLVYADSQSPTSLLHWYTLNDAAGISDSIGINNIAAASFNHVVVGYDGTNKFIYLNNVLQFNNVAVVGVSRGNHAMVFGNYSPIGATNGLAGNYDEIGYWGRALSAAEVNTLFNGGAGLPFGSF